MGQVPAPAEPGPFLSRISPARLDRIDVGVVVPPGSRRRGTWSVSRSTAAAPVEADPQHRKYVEHDKEDGLPGRQRFRAALFRKEPNRCPALYPPSRPLSPR